MSQPDPDDIERRMNGAVEVLRGEFSGLRAGRASAAVLEPLIVDAYGSKLPINQIGTINVPDPRMITIQVWDQGLIESVENAIRDSGLGLNPARDGIVVRVPIPQLSEERRIELTKIANKYAEQARIAIRNIRRDGMDKLKRFGKEENMSKDEQRAWGEDLQILTDKFIKDVDETLETKEKEIMQV